MWKLFSLRGGVESGPINGALGCEAGQLCQEEILHCLMSVKLRRSDGFSEFPLLCMLLCV